MLKEQGLLPIKMVSLQTRLVYNKHNVTVLYSLVIYLFKTTERPANNSTGVWNNFNSFKPAFKTYTQRHLHVCIIKSN